MKKEKTSFVTKKNSNKLEYKSDKQGGFKSPKGAKERAEKLKEPTRIEEVSSTGVDRYPKPNKKAA